MESEHFISVVTGANGFVGSHMVDKLLDQGHKVKCIVRNTSNTRWLEGKPIELYKCGLDDKKSLKEILADADYLFHIAGVVKAKNEAGYFKGNVDTTKNLLDTIVENNYSLKRVIVLSSLTSSGPSTNGKHITEDDKPNPITAYGRSKLAEEELTKKYMDKIPITIIRPPAIYGERDTEIYLFFKTYFKGLMALIGFDEKRVSIVHVADLVDGIYSAAKADNAVGQIYFIGSEQYYSWPEIGRAIQKATHKKAFILRLPHSLVYSVAAIAQFFSYFSSKAATFNLEKAKDFVQKYWTCDVSKAKRDFGYKQNISLEDGMKRTIDWYKEMKWL